MSAAAKARLRDEVWSSIRRAGIARFPGVEGRIPNFVGAEPAAERLAASEAWAGAVAIKSNPDSPQWPVRIRALADGKTVFMAVPRLREPAPFWRLALDELEVTARAASSIRGATRHGRPTSLDHMPRIDLVVCGSVAVDEAGGRLGKGGGYSDLEFALAFEAGIVGEWTTVVTTVHDIQVVEPGRIPMTSHDVPVDAIVTPAATIVCRRAHSRPGGVLWKELDQARLDSMPALQRLAADR